MISPFALKQLLPLPDNTKHQIEAYRTQIKNILTGKDKRFLVICGPCSIHDPQSALDYAQRFAQLAHQLEDRLLLVMRVYFEKPRTITGWKGLLNDPFLDHSFQIEAGFKIARQLLLDIAALNVPIATEALDLNSPAYLQDLISWYAIGARTTEAQTHREMASGFKMPVGFKNGTDGSLQIAINAMLSAQQAHVFLAPNQQGQISVQQTTGNLATHLILRGGKEPNYEARYIKQAEEELIKHHLAPKIMIDCSHSNSNKNYLNQVQVLESISSQIQQGNRSIFGIMLESHIHEGSQVMTDPKHLRYGVSVTDACIDWHTTANLLTQFAQNLT